MIVLTVKKLHSLHHLSKPIEKVIDNIAVNKRLVIKILYITLPKIVL